VNIKTCLILIIGILIFTEAVRAAEAEAPKSAYQLPRMVIANFTNSTSFKGLEGGLTERMTSLIAITKRFEVVERSQLESVLEEQKLGLAGILDESTAVEVGKILGAEIMVVGSITDAGYSQSEVVLEDGSTQITWEGSVAVSGRFVDVETGRVILSKVVRNSAQESDLERAKSDLEKIGEIVTDVVRGRDTATEEYYRKRGEETVSKALEEAGVSLVNAFLSELPLIGYVIAIQGNKVMVDLGREVGLKSKVNLLVYREGEPVKHPVTGEFVKKERSELGYLQVTDIEDRLSSAKSITDGLMGNVQVGDRVMVIPPVFLGHLAIMSAAVPGLGQAVEGKMLSGLFFLGVEGALVAFAALNALDANDIDKNLRSQYLNKTEADDAVARSWIWTFVMGAAFTLVKIVDVIDAGFPAEAYNPLALGSPSESRPSLALAPNRHGDSLISLRVGYGEIVANLGFKW
jgi:curli biogenesis system outer membrane secretion channel CsgG